ncbi:hypothetical protein P4S72_07715 [Vibrio sp. PP-XX7]
MSIGYTNIGYTKPHRYMQNKGQAGYQRNRGADLQLCRLNSLPEALIKQLDAFNFTPFDLSTDLLMRAARWLNHVNHVNQGAILQILPLIISLRINP